MARRRSNSLSITTILKKAQRQGASAFTLDVLLDRLRHISGQRPDRITDDARINVDTLLEEGIRLHPFLMQRGPITPDQIKNLRLPSPKARRRTLAPPQHEDLTLP